MDEEIMNGLESGFVHCAAGRVLLILLLMISVLYGDPYGYLFPVGSDLRPESNGNMEILFDKGARESVDIMFTYGIWSGYRYGILMSLGMEDGRRIYLVTGPDSENTVDFHFMLSDAQEILQAGTIRRDRPNIFEYHDVRVLFRNGELFLAVSDEDGGGMQSTTRMIFPDSVSSVHVTDIRFGPDRGKSTELQLVLKNIILKGDGIRGRWGVESEISEGVTVQRINLKGMSVFHSSWERLTHFYIWDYLLLDRLPVVYYPEERKIALLTKWNLWNWSLESNEQEYSVIPAAQMLSPQRMVYSEVSGTAVTYDEGLGDLSYFNYFSSEYGTWSVVDSSRNLKKYYDHGAAFDREGKLIAVGGIKGNTAFRDILRFEGGEYSVLDPETEGVFMPRYRSLIAANWNEGNRLFIFGGRGSVSGRLELGYQDLYDLWELDMAENTLKQVADLEDRLKPERILGMAVDAESESIFLCGSDSRKGRYGSSVHRYYPEKDRLVSVSSGLPTFTESFMFMDRSTGELLLAGRTAGDSTFMDLYRLLLPITEGEDVAVTGIEGHGTDDGIQMQSPDEEEERSDLYWSMVPAVLIIMFAGAYSLNRNIRRHNASGQGAAAAVRPGMSEPAIHLLGEFSLLDAEGHDHSGHFSGRNLEFLLLHLIFGYEAWKYGYSGEYSGVRTEMLVEHFWPEAGKAEVKNRKGVALNKLRKELAELDFITLNINKGNAVARVAEEVRVDLYELSSYLEKRSDPSERENIDLFLALTGRGELLKGLSYPWLDGIQQYTRERVTRILRSMLSAVADHDEQRALSVSDVLLKWDDLDEGAMMQKVRIYRRTGKHRLAQNEYDLFARRYETVYGEPFDPENEELDGDL